MKHSPFSSRRLSERLVTFALAAAIVGCAAPTPEPAAEPQPVFDAAAEAEVIKALERQWMQRLMADDVDWIVDLYAEDAWRLPPGAEPVVGHEALRAAWQEMALTEGLEITWESTVARVSAAGDMAYDLGDATITNPDGQVQPAKYLVVWVRRGGRWKVAADMFSANGPPVAPTASDALPAEGEGRPASG